MSNKIVWWPASIARSMTLPVILLVRYDWPDQIIYEFCQYEPGRLPSPWTDGRGGILQTPDYFTDSAKILEFIKIPKDREYVYRPQQKGDHNEHETS